MRARPKAKERCRNFGILLSRGRINKPVAACYNEIKRMVAICERAVIYEGNKLENGTFIESVGDRCEKACADMDSDRQYYTNSIPDYRDDPWRGSLEHRQGDRKHHADGL